MTSNDRHTRTTTAAVGRRTVPARRSRSRAPTAVVVLAVASAALAAGCSRAAGPSGLGPPSPPAVQQPSVTTGDTAPSATRPAGPPAPPVSPPAPSVSPPPFAPAPTAAADLAAYFAAAEAADARIRAAAVAINRGIGPTTVQIPHSTRDLIVASVPREAGRAVPVGMRPDLQRAVLLVHSELIARSAAFNSVPVGETLPRTDPASVRMFDALRVGSAIARRYPHDLAAARRLAHDSPPLPRVGASSRRAAELALQIAVVKGENNGCGSAGGYLYTGPRPILWKRIVTDYGRFDGTIGGIMFAATYSPADGWKVGLNAC
jgi:hypothetical protein